MRLSDRFTPSNYPHDFLKTRKIPASQKAEDPQVCAREVIMMKFNACLRGGAREAIVVGLKGEIEFFGPAGKLDSSAHGIRLELPSELF
ncbi:MAG: hypothetical protein ACREEM_52040 [Blastocatellia bacterium]